MSDTTGTDPVDAIGEAIAVVEAVAGAVTAPAPAAAPSLPALGDAIHVAGRSGVVFGACQRDGRIFVTLAPGDDWLPV